MKGTSMVATSTLERRTFDAPDETRPAGSGNAAILKVAEIGLMQVTLPPGWRWSRDVQPIAHTDSCQAPHVVYILSGHIHVAMDDGTETDLGPQDVGVVPPGHDAWTVGDQPVVYLDITGSAVWARPK
jgi:mannose-6-phosphate isomerase-like protein (cupin superfamily)